MDRVLHLTLSQAIDLAIEVLGGAYSGFVHPEDDGSSLIYLLGRRQFAIVYPAAKGALLVSIDYDSHGMQGLQARLCQNEGFSELGVTPP